MRIGSVTWVNHFHIELYVRLVHHSFCIHDELSVAINESVECLGSKSNFRLSARYSDLVGESAEGLQPEELELAQHRHQDKPSTEARNEALPDRAS